MTPEHHGMNGPVKVTWRTLCKIAHYFIVQSRVSEVYINLALMYTTDRILPVLHIKDMINMDGEMTTQFKLATCTKPEVWCYFVHVLYRKILHTATKRC